MRRSGFWPPPLFARDALVENEAAVDLSVDGNVEAAAVVVVNESGVEVFWKPGGRIATRRDGRSGI